MITIFTVPKPFNKSFDRIQRNSLESWIRLSPKPEIILLGDDHGVAEVSAEYGLKHISGIKKNHHETPYLDDIFKKAQLSASHPIVAYINTDIILFDDFMRACASILHFEKNFMMAGERIDLDLEEKIDFTQPDWQKTLIEFAHLKGTPHGFGGVDYFVFKKKCMPKIPPFLIGRKYYDNWFFWWAIKHKLSVIDASPSVVTIHQNHDRTYSSLGREVPNNQDNLRNSHESKQNFMSAGGQHRILNIRYATDVLVNGKLIAAHGERYLVFKPYHPKTFGIATVSLYQKFRYKINHASRAFL